MRVRFLLLTLYKSKSLRLKRKFFEISPGFGVKLSLALIAAEKDFHSLMLCEMFLIFDLLRTHRTDFVGKIVILFGILHPSFG